MKYTRFFFILILIHSSCQNKSGNSDFYQNYPPYKLVNLYSQKIKGETGLILSGYAVNWRLPKEHKTNGIGNFVLSYKLLKERDREFSLDYARNLIVFLTENLLLEINSNLDVKDNLDVYPFVSDLIDITLHFKDENQVELGQGVARVYFKRGQIEYQGYEIEGFRKEDWAYGKHYKILEESYEEALEIVKSQGSLKYI